jgi:hypothetical protein
LEATSNLPWSLIAQSATHSLQAAKIDYKKVLETPTSTMNIDFAFNKAIFGY